MTYPASFPAEESVPHRVNGESCSARQTAFLNPADAGSLSSSQKDLKRKWDVALDSSDVALKRPCVSQRDGASLSTPRAFVRPQAASTPSTSQRGVKRAIDEVLQDDGSPRLRSRPLPHDAPSAPRRARIEAADGTRDWVASPCSERAGRRRREPRSPRRAERSPQVSASPGFVASREFSFRTDGAKAFERQFAEAYRAGPFSPAPSLTLTTPAPYNAKTQFDNLARLVQEGVCLAQLQRAHRRAGRPTSDHVSRHIVGWVEKVRVTWQRLDASGAAERAEQLKKKVQGLIKRYPWLAKSWADVMQLGAEESESESADAQKGGEETALPIAQPRGRPAAGSRGHQAPRDSDLDASSDAEVEQKLLSRVDRRAESDRSQREAEAEPKPERRMPEPRGVSVEPQANVPDDVTPGATEAGCSARRVSQAAEGGEAETSKSRVCKDGETAMEKVIKGSALDPETAQLGLGLIVEAGKPTDAAPSPAVPAFSPAPVSAHNERQVIKPASQPVSGPSAGGLARSTCGRKRPIADMTLPPHWTAAGEGSAGAFIVEDSQRRSKRLRQAAQRPNEGFEATAPAKAATAKPKTTKLGAAEPAAVRAAKKSAAAETRAAKKGAATSGAVKVGAAKSKAVRSKATKPGVPKPSAMTSQAQVGGPRRVSAEAARGGKGCEG